MNQQPQQQTDERGGLSSASGLDSEMRCLGRRNFIRETGSEKKDDEKSKKAAESGNNIHKALETNDFESLSDSEKITASIIAFQEGQLVENNSFEGAAIIKEERYWLSHNFKPIFSGKPDTIYHSGERALNINYKTGFSFVVPIERNWQMRAEAVLIAESLGVSTVIGALVHPFHPETFRQEATFNQGHLEAYRETMVQALQQMDEPTAPRTPNPVSCMYCPAKALCPEHKYWVDSVAKEKVDSANISPEQRGFRMDEIKYVKKTLDQEEKTYKELMKLDPKAIKGWRLSPAFRREVNDMLRAKEIITEAWGQTVYDSSVALSLPKVEAGVYDLKKKLDKKFTKSKAKDEVEMRLANVVTKTRQEPRLLQSGEDED